MKVNQSCKLLVEKQHITVTQLLLTACPAHSPPVRLKVLPDIVHYVFWLTSTNYQGQVGRHNLKLRPLS